LDGFALRFEGGIDTAKTAQPPVGQVELAEEAEGGVVVMGDTVGVVFFEKLHGIFHPFFRLERVGLGVDFQRKKP
jgi:hypothetical protein